MLSHLPNRRVIHLAVVDRGGPFAHTMGHADFDGAGAHTTLAIVGLEGQLIDTAVTVPGSFGTDGGRTSLNHGIRTRVAVALGVDRLILRHARHGDLHGKATWISDASDGDRDKL